MFSLESRLKHIESLCKTYPNVSVETYAGLTIDLLQIKKGAVFD
jgi:phosphopantetheine adenylyltransferase